MCRSKADGGRRCGAGTADLTPAQAADSIGITRAGLKARLAEGTVAVTDAGRIAPDELERFRAARIREMSASLADDF